ncbi:MAG: phospholipase D family protein [Nocardioidaceae bacterium]
MMLAPETRVMLTDALRPPDGFRVDIAVATTYSLDLTALLLAPMAFAMFDHEKSEDLDRVDPIQLLEAVRRYAERTTVFCQAGAIAVPSSYRSILTFVEESVLEVMPPTAGRIFHPKVWAIRFVDSEGSWLHRCLCLSRNLTFDKSWDTAVRLDEQPGGKGEIKGKPLAAFVGALPELATRGVLPPRRAQIVDLAASLETVRFMAPAPFVRGRLLPIGLGSQPWPFPSAIDRLLALSPFVSKGTMARLTRASKNRILVSRPETLDRLGSEALAGWQTQTLQRIAEVEVGDDTPQPQPALSEWQSPREGLHAKTFVCDTRPETLVVTGSANLTNAPWHGNIEFDVVLGGPKKTCGISATLDGSTDVPGLSNMLEDYQVSSPDGVLDAAQELSWELELFHQRLAASGPVLTITRLEDDRVSLRLTFDVDELLGDSVLWPISLPAATSSVRLDDDHSATWPAVSGRNVTPFVAIETVLVRGGVTATRRCVLAAGLKGDTGSRRTDAIRDVLRSKQDVLRYLVFLLGDPAYDAWFTQEWQGGEPREYGDAPAGTRPDIAVFEPLVRAAGHDTDALARVASLIQDLHDMATEGDLLPDGFDELWSVVWEVHKEGMAR